MDNTLINGPRILRYLEKSLQMTSKEFAEYCGYSYSNYRQNIMSGKTSIDIGTYFTLQKKHGFNLDAIMQGQFNMNDSDASKSFTMPDRWRDYQYSSGKILHLYVSFFEQVLGEGKFIEFCRHQSIDPMYFYNKSNPINIEFIQRMLQEIALRKKYKLDHLTSKLAHFSVIESSSIIGKITNELKNEFDENKSLQVIGKFLTEVGKLEYNHTYTVENQTNDSITISAKPNDHINMSLWATDPLIGGFIDQLLPKVITFTGISNEYKVQTIASAKRHGERSIFKVAK